MDNFEKIVSYVVEDIKKVVLNREFRLTVVKNNKWSKWIKISKITIKEITKHV